MPGSTSSDGSTTGSHSPTSNAARIAELEAKVADLEGELRRLRNGFRIAGAVALEAGDLPFEIVAGAGGLLEAASGG